MPPLHLTLLLLSFLAARDLESVSELQLFDLKTQVQIQAGMIFHFVQNAWGKGYATEAGRGCLDNAFEVLAPVKVIAGCHPNHLQRHSWMGK